MSVGSADIGGFGSVKGEGVPGGGSPVTTVVAGDGGISVSRTGNTVTVAQVVGAEWPVAIPRIYAIDGALGNDANKGFADPVSASPTDYAAGCAAAGLVAKKTLAGLAAIFPSVGNGRLVVVLIKSGTYVGGLGTFLNGSEGYADGAPLVRGTVTDATASSVAFAGDINDATMAGGIRIPGLNNAGYHPTGVPTTNTIQLVKVGGGGPAFPADPDVPTGWRLRFDNNAPTQAALRNSCTQVANHTGGDTVELQFDLAVPPVATDVCYLEKAGLLWDGTVVSPANNGVSNSDFAGGGSQIVGVDQTSAFTAGSAQFTFYFCGALSATINNSLFQTAPFYVDPVLGFIGVGGGLLLQQSSTFTSCFSGQSSSAFGSLFGLVCVQDLLFVEPLAITYSVGCACRRLTVQGAELGANNNTNFVANLGSTGFTTGIPRAFGGNAFPMAIIDSQIRIEDLNVTGAGNNPAIIVDGKNTIVVSGALGGSSGNNDIGMDFQKAFQCVLILTAGTVPTVTGAAGDVRWCGQALAAWTNFNFQAGWDIGGNHILEFVTNGEYRHGVNRSVILGVNNSGAAIATAFQLVRSNGTNLQFVPAQADTAAHAAGFMGISEAITQNGAAGLVGMPDGARICHFDGAPVVGGIVYLSPGAAGAATTTVPALSLTNQKLRLGVCIGNSFPGNLGLVRWNPENIPVLADGNP
jgi:hypothetical protein